MKNDERTMFSIRSMAEEAMVTGIDDWGKLLAIFPR